MAENEVVPWKSLKGQNTTSLRRIAYMLRAIMHDDNGKPSGCAWGYAGEALAQEILNYCAFADGQKKRRDEIKNGRTVRESDPRNAQAKAVVDHFDRYCKKVMGAPPSQLNWGWAIKQTYGLMNSGWDVEVIKALVPVFFDCRHDKGYIFRRGAYADFVENILRLKQLYDEKGVTQSRRPTTLS